MSEQSPYPELVVDTSVVVKFFVEEEGSDEADELLARFIAGELRLVALDFLFIEFANVMWTKTRLRELTSQEAEEKIRRLLELSSLMDVVPSAGILLQAFGNALKYDLAVYDSALVALATCRGLQFVTADIKLYRKVKRRSPAALLLTDWRPA
jgi:predicted nucleic acid-binding protein